MGENMNHDDVKYSAVVSNQGVHPSVSLAKKEFDWLIEQAEKAERYEKALTEIADEGHSFIGEVSKFCINTARRALGKEKLLC